MNDSTVSPEKPALLETLFELLAAHRPIFRQERTFQRVWGLLMGELFVFARHTVTQQLLALGLTDGDWTAWYRLFSRERFNPQQASACLLGLTLADAPVQEPYVVGIDGVQVPRSSQKMPGTSWLKALRTPPFRAGIHRAQRFVNLSWLTPPEEGFRRAVPLGWWPAFPEKAVPADSPARKEWEAGAEAVAWTRTQLDAAGREAQPLVVLADGSFEKPVAFWQALPERTVVLARCARNRVLYGLPGDYAGRGRPPVYGDRLPSPAGWLRVPGGWQKTTVAVRGHGREMRWRVVGPCLREGLPEQPVFLLVVRGQDRHVGKRRVRRDPAFFLVNAVAGEAGWALPFPVETLLALAWQRWELEVSHREVKSSFGLGQKQCWNRRAAVVSVQWSAWAYGLLLLAGYRTWGLLTGPPAPGRWWPGGRRWSFNTLWRAYRAELWGRPDFRAVWTRTGDNWLKKGDWLAALWNAASSSARS